MELQDFLDYVNQGSTVKQPSEEIAYSGYLTQEALKITMKMILAIDGTEVAVEWEDNESADALRELIKDKPLTVSMSMYGGFEQVGFLGTRLPRDDEQTTTSAGDIVLYSGNQIVIFYGSNTWAYTPLGRITGLSQDELRSLLGNGDVTVTLTYSSPQGS